MRNKYLIIGAVMISILVGGIGTNRVMTMSVDSEENVKDEQNLFNKFNKEKFEVADNAIYCNSKDKKEKMDEYIDEMYSDISNERIDELEELDVEDLRNDIVSFGDKYEVGEPFTKEDQEEFLYAIETYGQEVLHDNNEYVQVANTNRKYHVANSKSKNGVTVAYDGYLTTYTPAIEGGQYGTNVNVYISAGKSNLKSMKWTTHHTGYGVIGGNGGSDGASVAIGIVYNNSMSSSKYTSNFNFCKTQKYSGVLVCYVKTWGTLNVNTKNGEFNMNTQTYSSWE